MREYRRSLDAIVDSNGVGIRSGRTMRENIDYIVGSKGVLNDGNDNAELKICIANVNDSPEEALNALRAWRATAPEAAKYWPAMVRALIYTTPEAEPLSREVIDGIVSLDAADTRHLALRRLPRGLAGVLDAEVVVSRVGLSIADACTVANVDECIELLLSLAEHALGAFEQAVRPETKVGYQVHWMRPLGDSMRKPLAHIVFAIVSSLPASTVDRIALFRRLWAWLRQGWLDEFRYVKFDNEGAHRSEPHERIASILNTKEAANEAVKVLREETKTVQGSPTFRPLLFALLAQLDDPDALREALPASPTWQHHAMIASAYEKCGRGADAVAYLKTLRESADRDALLQRLLRETTTPDEAFASERPHPSNLDALMKRYGKSRQELVVVGVERMRRGEEDQWLDFLVREAEWKQALVVTKGADPECVLRILSTPLPQTQAHELARTCLEHVLDTKKVWRDAARAKEVVALLVNKTVELAPDAKARNKAMKQARTRTDKVIQKSADFFVRELAFALDEALLRHEAHFQPAG